MMLLSNGHKGSLFAVCHVEARLVRILVRYSLKYTELIAILVEPVWDNVCFVVG